MKDYCVRVLRAGHLGEVGKAVNAVREIERQRWTEKYREKERGKERVHKWKADQRDQRPAKRRRCDGARALIEVHVLTRTYLLGYAATACTDVQRMRNVGDAGALSSVLPRGRVASFAVSTSVNAAYACVKCVLSRSGTLDAPLSSRVERVKNHTHTRVIIILHFWLCTYVTDIQQICLHFFYIQISCHIRVSEYNTFIIVREKSLSWRSVIICVKRQRKIILYTVKRLCIARELDIYWIINIQGIYIHQKSVPCISFARCTEILLLISDCFISSWC